MEFIFSENVVVLSILYLFILFVSVFSKERSMYTIDSWYILNILIYEKKHVVIFITKQVV